MRKITKITMLVRVPHLVQEQPIFVCDKTGANYK